jgi:hypothetical protein
MSEEKMKKYVSITLLFSLLLALIPFNLAQASGLQLQASCTDKATFISDVTIPDKTKIEAGKSFEKTWRLKNSGTCTWSTSYAMVFASGSQMGGPASVALPKSVSPNGTVDLKVTLTAPSASGTYTGNWKLRNAGGLIFGLGTKADQPFWVQIVVGTSSPPNSGGSSGWKAQYFANTDLYGNPKVTRTDSKIDFDWQRNAPAAGMPKDNFSVRWTQTVQFSAGIYRFNLLADDKATLYVGDRMVLRVPALGSTQGSYDLALLEGSQKVTLEYREFTGNARVRLSWQKISASFTDWKGEYWTNAELKGNPAISRNDKAIDFRWREKAPVLGMPRDKFSARWTRTVNFTDDTYRFSAKADDGIRIFIDGKRLLDEWHTAAGNTIYTFDKQLKGNHTIVVEYYEGTGNAVVKVWWDKIVPVPPTPTTPPTISSVTSSNITSGGATITWTTNEASDSQVEYGLTTSYGSSTTLSTSMVTSHSVPLSGLSASTTYHYRVKSKNAAGNLGVSSDYSFTTQAPPEPQNVYSFAEQYCTAEWSSGAGVLPCPGTAGESGYVLRPENPVLENGATETRPTLLTVPQQIADGLIRGTFPEFNVQSGDHFKATIGCLSGAPSCNVMFQLNYKIGDGSIQNLASWTEEANNSQIQTVDIDLTLLAGKSVKFILTVLANGQPTDDQALWILPRIMR